MIRPRFYRHSAQTKGEIVAEQDDAMVVDRFWESDLEDIEAQFLPEGKEITDLEPYFHNSVPSQGSVLLGNARKISVADATVWDRIRLFIFELRGS